MPTSLVLSDMKRHAETASLLIACDGGIRRKELRGFVLGKKFRVRIGTRSIYLGNSLARAVKAYNKAEGRT